MLPVQAPLSASAWAKLLDQVSNTRATEGNRVQPYIDGQNAFPQILESLQAARKSILVETYQLVAGDKTSEQIVQALIAAKQRGVSVHVLVDAMGSRNLLFEHNAEIGQLQAAGVDIKLFNPIKEPRDFLHRDHRKVMVVDGGTAWVGGMNLGDRWLGSSDVKGRFHDLTLKVQGPAVSEVATAFGGSWKDATGETLPAALTAPAAHVHGGKLNVRILAHVGHRDDTIRRTMVALIDHARRNVNLENSYPLSSPMLDALKAAAQRGVRVNLFVGHMGLLGVVNEAYFPGLLRAGVHIYQYPESIHSKALSVDGQVAMVGSANVDSTSSHNDEIVAVMNDATFTRGLDASLFGHDQRGDASKGTVPVTLAEVSGPMEWLRKALAFVWPRGLQ
jgi:cardiolipin synthase